MSVRRIVRLIVIGVLLATFSGTAHADDQTETKVDEDTAVKKACFRVRDTRSLSAVDDRNVYLRCIRDRHYLLTMGPACIGLENSIGVAVSNKFDRVCSNDRAWITYKDFNQTRRCDIVTVEQVENRDQAISLIKERKPTGGQTE